MVKKHSCIKGGFTWIWEGVPCNHADLCSKPLWMHQQHEYFLKEMLLVEWCIKIYIFKWPQYSESVLCFVVCFRCERNVYQLLKSMELLPSNVCKFPDIDDKEHFKNALRKEKEVCIQRQENVTHAVRARETWWRHPHPKHLANHLHKHANNKR